MALPAALLLLLGFTLHTATAFHFDTTSEVTLWAESESLIKPWANLILTCEARYPTRECQLIRDGMHLNQVRSDSYTTSYKFPLGAITSENRGLYRCRCGVDLPTSKVTELTKWTGLSNLLEVTGTEPLPRPSIAAQPVSWYLQGLSTTVLCQAGLRGVTYLLRREGDDDFLKVAKAGEKGQASFPINQPGNYTCSYRTHDAGDPSEPSAAVTIEKYVKPPPPTLSLIGNYPKINFQSTQEILVCKASLSVPEFQLKRGEEEMKVYGARPRPDIILYFLNLTDLDGQGPFTCSYRLYKRTPWSEDSEPIELMWSDESLPAPVLTAEPSSQSLEPGLTVHLRCTAPKAGLCFGLQRHDKWGDALIQMLKPSETEAVFELPSVSTLDNGNYSCVYMELAPPFSGSAPSELLELHVNGPPPKPRLQALWTGPVPLGREANMRCHGHVPKVSMELRREGFDTPFWMDTAIKSTSADLKLPFVGPQHTANYSCRYTALPPFTFESGLSDPVEVIVGGS